MLSMIRDGGFPMWFILIFGAVALFGGTRAVLHPDRRHLAFVKGMIKVLVAASVSGICACLATVFHSIPGQMLSEHPPAELADKWHLVTLLGVGESLSCGIIGFAFVAVTALCGAVAAQRLPADAA
jgi:hypothetical protein